MAESFQSFTCIIPAQTLVPAVATVSLAIGTNVVDRIRWRVPPGPRGNMGWWLSMGGVQVLPAGIGDVIIADNEWDDWYVDGLPNTGAWELQGWNNGQFDHAVYIEMFYSTVSNVTTGTGDILAGFPGSDADVPTMWLT